MRCERQYLYVLWWNEFRLYSWYFKFLLLSLQSDSILIQSYLLCLEGANDFGVHEYMPDITSYDYDAIMTEAGDPNGLKYSLVKDVIEKHFQLTPGVVPPAKPKMSLDTVKLEPIGELLSLEGLQYLGNLQQRHPSPITFEKLGQNSGLVLYETFLPSNVGIDPTLLTVNELRDRALVFIDKWLIGILSRENDIKSLPIHSFAGRKLQILVENQGRINFNVFNDIKVISFICYFHV